MVFNICEKFVEDWPKGVKDRASTSNLLSNFCKSRTVTKALHVEIELSRDTMVPNIYRKFEEDWS